MGIPVLVIGESGTGKSTSMRNLDPNCFSLVNVGRKPLPFKSEKKGLETDDYARIMSAIEQSKQNLFVIDDAQYLMANAYMRSTTMKFSKDGMFDFYKQIGKNFWDLVVLVQNLPPEKIVYFLGHVEVDNFGKTKFKTIGKLLDEKITVEGMFTIVMRTRVEDNRYFFSTQNDGNDTVKTPLGMFADRLIDNDLALVDTAIRDYYGLVDTRRTA